MTKQLAQLALSKGLIKLFKNNCYCINQYLQIVLAQGFSKRPLMPYWGDSFLDFLCACERVFGIKHDL